MDRRCLVFMGQGRSALVDRVTLSGLASCIGKSRAPWIRSGRPRRSPYITSRSVNSLVVMSSSHGFLARSVGGDRGGQHPTSDPGGADVRTAAREGVILKGA